MLTDEEVEIAQKAADNWPKRVNGNLWYSDESERSISKDIDKLEKGISKNG